MPDSLMPFCAAPHQFLLDTALKADPRFRMGDETFLVLSDPAAVHAVLNGKFDDFEKGAMVEIPRTFLHDGIIMVEVPEWTDQQKMIAPQFAGRRMRQLEPVIADLVTRQIDTWAALPAGEPVDLLAATNRLVFDIVATGMLSITDPAVADAVFETLVELDSTESVRLHYLLKRFGGGQGGFGRSSYAQAIERMQRLAAAIADERLARATQPDDFVGGVMATAAFAAFTPERKRAFLTDQISTMLTAGYVTTGETLFWGLYLLAKHPAQQQRARAEIAANTTAMSGAVPFDAPPFLMAAFNESQRLYPAVWFLGRVARRDVRVGDIDIAAGTRVMCSPYVLHRTPTLWPDSDQYRPERFLPGASHPVAPRSLIPFGTGMRACVGRGLALMEISAVACMTLSRFELELVSDAPIELTGAFSMHPRDTVMVRLKPLA
ncbi:cytochrome P450 [Phenylobacterium sp. LjRoot219]|uniref:cytochrome P450 n=1 Tax=Phenylobacterium sp. LjRoot219 TaxID=3342283 RepID=UPI003ECEB4D8